MTDGEVRGIPAIAAQRIARAAASGVATSLLSVPDQAGLDASGFVPVGEVMGCDVMHIGFRGYGGCGWGVGYFAPTETITNRSGGYFGLGPYLDAIRAGWDLALSRMLAEATALRADGVVGVRLTEQNLGEDNREFVALGTAVRSLGATHLRRPFSTTLGGSDVTKLLLGGYAPAGTIVAIAVGIRHDDYRTRQATMLFAGNTEVPGYTDLVHTVRQEVRSDLARRTAAIGADGSILTEPMALRIHELEVSEGHRDHVGMASLVATAVARTRTVTSRNAPRPLAVMSMADLRRGARP